MPYETKGGVIAPVLLTCQTCEFNGMCRFDQKRLGGFKGEGPKYIGYRLITDRTERNSAKEDTMTCFNFVNALQRRMLHGQALRADGKDGEIIKVVAQEGEAITRRIRVGMNSRGEIVRPQAEIIEALKKSGHKVATDDMTHPTTWREVEYKATVPRFAEEAAKINGYSQGLLARELSEQQMEDAAEDEAWEQARAKQMKSPDTALPPTATPSLRAK